MGNPRLRKDFEFNTKKKLNLIMALKLKNPQRLRWRMW